MAGKKGRSGRRRKPTGTKKLEGTYRKDRASSREPAPARFSRIPGPPAWLDGRVARDEWRRVAKQLHANGMLTKVDQTPLAAYCSAVQDLASALETIKSEGRYSRTSSGYVQAHPAVTIANRARELIKSYGQEFGFTPSARAGIDLGQPIDVDDEPEDQFENYLDEGAKSRATVLPFDKKA